MGSLAINQQTAQRIRAYLHTAGHADDLDGPLFRPLRNNGLVNRSLGPDVDAGYSRIETRSAAVRRFVSAIAVVAGAVHSVAAPTCAAAEKQRRRKQHQPDLQ